MSCIVPGVLFLLFHISYQSQNISDIIYFRHLGTKTPYRLVANYDDSEVSYPGCKAVKIIGIIRHGTRNPGHKNVKHMMKMLPVLKEDFINHHNIFNSKDGLSNETMLLLKNWNFFMDTEGEKFLTREGEREMHLLAKRLQNRYPSLLNNYKNDTYLFKFTKTQRTEESAKHFTFGLFGNESDQVWFPEPQDPDPVLRFYKLCDRWRKEVKKSNVSTVQRKKFIRSIEMQRVLQAISEKLGLSYCLSFDAVQLMYMTCSFETAWFPDKISPWCSLFQPSDIKVLEYGEELKYYWRDGYGFDINYKQSCPLFKHILNFLLNKEESERAAIFYFTHSGTILKSVSHLGLYKDPFAMTSGLDPSKREARQWRVSYIDTFGANLMFTLFRCEGNSEKVLVSHQEEHVQIGSCPPPPQLCPLSEIRKVLLTGEGCDFHNLCSIQKQ